MNALSRNNYETFVKGVKLVYSQKSSHGDIGFLLMGDNHDEYEIPLLPGFKIVYKYLAGVEKVFFQTPEGELKTFKSYIFILSTENEYSKVLNKDPYWKETYYNQRTGVYDFPRDVSYLKLLLDGNEEGFGDYHDVDTLLLRDQILTLIK